MALKIMRDADARAQILLFADDTQLQIDADKLGVAHAAVSAEWARAGLSLNPGKTKVFSSDPDVPLGTWGQYRVATMKCLGADLVDDGIAWEHPSQGGPAGGELVRAAAKVEAFAARRRGRSRSCGTLTRARADPSVCRRHATPDRRG